MNEYFEALLYFITWILFDEKGFICRIIDEWRIYEKANADIWD